MNDTKPFIHGQEGTHYACQEKIKELGSNVGCCGCNNHDCRREDKTMKSTIASEKEKILKDYDEYDSLTIEIDDYDITGHGASHTELDFDKVRNFLSQSLDHIASVARQEGREEAIDLLNECSYDIIPPKDVADRASWVLGRADGLQMLRAKLTGKEEEK